MKSWKVEAAIIAVGLLLLGIMVKGGINNFVNKDRVVATWLIVIMPRLSSLSLPRMWIGYVNSCPGKQNS